jgi:hypothetical protein
MPSVFQDLETSNEAIKTATESTALSVSSRLPSLLDGAQPVAIRRDAEVPYDLDGEAAPLLVGSTGRLKVESLPIVPAVTIGSIITTQPSINTPVAGGVVSASVTTCGSVILYCTGTFSTINCTFEGSIDGGTTWFGILAARTNANTVEATTGNLSAMPAYGWRIGTAGLTNVRVRATARTSGTQDWRISRSYESVEPVPAIQTHAVTGSGTFTVSGSVTATPATPSTTRTVTLNTTNLSFLKASAGTLFCLSIFNSSGATIYIKLYNKTSAPVLASDVPTLIIPVVAGAFITHNFGAVGERFATGIAIAVTGGLANTDTTPVAASININTTFI